MMEYQAIIKIGRATLKVLFTDGSLTAFGQNPAKYTTSDFVVQHAIENSSDFKRGRITVVNAIELDEEVRIERNPTKKTGASTGAQGAGTGTQGDGKGAQSASTVAQSVAQTAADGGDGGTEAQGGQGAAEEATASEAATTASVEVTAEGEAGASGGGEAGASDGGDAAGDEKGADGGMTEVEFATNQEAKDYLAATFGVTKAFRNRAEIVACGETYGVKISFTIE